MVLRSGPIIRSGFPRAGSLSGNQKRDEFEANLLSLGDARFLWLPRPTETTTSTDRSRYARTGTYDASVASQYVTLGSGVGVTWDGTSDSLYYADADDLSFGDGVVDQPLSMIALVNVTADANEKDLLSKQTSGAAANREYSFYFDSSERFFATFTDESASAIIGQRDAVTTGGASRLVAASYDGSASRAGIVVYEAGLRSAMTSADSGTYTAMENKGERVYVGASTNALNTPRLWFSGIQYFVVLYAKALTDDDMWQAKRWADAYYGVTL